MLCFVGSGGRVCKKHTQCFYPLLGLNEVSVPIKSRAVASSSVAAARLGFSPAHIRAVAFLGMLSIPYLWNPTLQSLGFLGMLSIPYPWNPTLQSHLRALAARGVKEASVQGPGHSLGIVGGQLELRASLPAGGRASPPFQVPGPFICHS